MSELQEWMLRAALDELLRNSVPLAFWQVKQSYFGLSREHDGELWVFAKSQNPKYNAASAAVSRAARRLQKRGLALVISAEGHQQAQIALTTSGFEAANDIEKARGPGAFGFDPITQSNLRRLEDRIASFEKDNVDDNTRLRVHQFHHSEVRKAAVRARERFNK